MITVDGKRMFDGKTLFELKATHGLPLDFALDRIINEENLAVDWAGFIDEARRNQWYDHQIYSLICYAIEDAMLPKDMQAEIKTRLQRYLLILSQLHSPA